MQYKRKRTIGILENMPLPSNLKASKGKLKRTVTLEVALFQPGIIKNACCWNLFYCRHQEDATCLWSSIVFLFSYFNVYL